MNLKQNLLTPLFDGFLYKLTNFSDSTNRGVYLYVNLVLSIVYIVLLNTLSSDHFEIASWVMLILYTPITIRRMRDTGKSLLNFGWFVLPFIGWFYGLYLLFIKKNPNYSVDIMKSDNTLYYSSTLAIILITVIGLYKPSLIGLKINNNPTVFAFEYAHTHPQVSMVIDSISDFKSQPFIDFVWAQMQFYSPPTSPSHNPTAALDILTAQSNKSNLTFSSASYDLFIMTASEYYPQNPKVKNPIFNLDQAHFYYNILEGTSSVPTRPEMESLVKLLYTDESHQHIHQLFK